MSTYHCVKVIWNGMFSTNSLYQIDKERVIVGRDKRFSIVNIAQYAIEKPIEEVNCFLKLRDNKTILFCCGNGIFGYYDMTTKEYMTTKNNTNIMDLSLIIDDDFFFFVNYCKDFLRKVFHIYNKVSLENILFNSRIVNYNL